MIARHYRPAAPLSAFVDLFWYYAGFVREHSKERLLPTGTIELVINLREDEVRTYDPDDTSLCQRLPGSVVVGAHSRYFVLDTAEQNDVIGIHFKPGGAFPFLAPPADAFRDAHVPLDAIWGGSVARLRERLLAAPTPEAKFALLEGALLEHVSDQAQPHAAVAHAIRCLDGAPHLHTITRLTERIGLSPKRFIQLFSQQVGLTPKLYCRVQRFQRVVQTVQRQGRVDWADVAAGCGYYDQAHFIRDFRAFSGLNPSAYLGSRGEYINHVPMRD
ncbi:MAG: helix-turn-helix domain-containing protein [Nevskia sp.]|nr:helix-turn-helix domain-containing protein [Nevskia sp.]